MIEANINNGNAITDTIKILLSGFVGQFNEIHIVITIILLHLSYC